MPLETTGGLRNNTPCRDAKMHFLNKNNAKQAIWDAVFVLFSLSILGRLLVQLFSTYAYDSYQISEFLINYQGGFVRRGLMGEALLLLAKTGKVNVESTIKIFCLVCLVAVSVFFIKSFLNKGYPLYILPLCFFLGSNIVADNWIRKDCLFFCVFISILWLYGRNRLPMSVRMSAINILSVLMTLCHEVFVFIALPILFLLLFHRHKNIGVSRSILLSMLFLSPTLFCFFLCAVFHGNPETAEIIWASWTAFLYPEASTMPEKAVSIAAIGWSSTYAAKLHFTMNFLSADQGVSSLLVWTMTFPAVYYIVVNVPTAFRKNEDVFSDRHRNALSSVLIFQLLCLAPVFILLSCDYIRVFFYWTASSFVIFLLLPTDTVKSLFPAVWGDVTERLNGFLTGMLSPTKTTLAFLMLFIGISPIGTNVLWLSRTTMLYNVLVLLSLPLKLLKDFICGGPLA